MTAFFSGPDPSSSRAPAPNARDGQIRTAAAVPEGLPTPPQAAPSSRKGPPARAWAQRRLAATLGALLLCLYVLCGLPGRGQAGPVPAMPSAPHMGLLPYLDAFLDPTGSMDVDEAAAPANAAAFKPLSLPALPRTTGVLWLRFTLAPLPQGLRPAALLLDLGPAVPAGPILYAPHTDPLTEATEWRETTPSQRNVLLLPEAAAQPLTCYLRLDGLPGPWFAPTLRTPQDAASNWDSLAGTAAVLALGVVLLLCLLRGLSEKGQWRGWTALYVGVALLQAVLGMPAYGEGRITPAEAAAVLAPGLALMLLPHVGRHLLRTRGRSRALDAQFLLLSLPGAALALLPLLPGFGWLVRYLALWPACTVLFAPTALAGALMGLGGARRFLLGCLLPPLFVAASLLGLDQGYAAGLLAAAPLWGTALSALLIAGTGQPKDMAATPKNAAAPDPLLALAEDPARPEAATSGSAAHTDVITLDQPLDDPNLRLLPSLDPLPTDGLPDLSGLPDGQDWTPPAKAASRAAAPAPAAFADRDALRPPLEKILREGAALLGCALPPAVRQHAENLRSAADDLARALDNPGALSPASAGPPARAAFNLQHLVREAHDAVAVTAENAGIGLAWYLPPLLGHVYEGPGQALRQVLGDLLESAVRATARGAVHLTVRRVPESADPGHLLFTVTDTGAGLPPRQRSGQALLQAWELAGACNGYLTVDSGPQGASIAFTLRLKPLEGEEEAETAPQAAPAAAPTVAVAGADAEERETLIRLCREAGCRCAAAPDPEAALNNNAASPAVLLTVFHPQHGPAQADMLGRFEADAQRAGLGAFKALAVTRNQRHWDDLAETGYTHALLTPLDAAAFAATLREVLDEAGIRPDSPLPPVDAEAPQKNAPLPDLFGPSTATTADTAATAPTPQPEPAPQENGPTALALPDPEPEAPTPSATAARPQADDVPGPDDLASVSPHVPADVPTDAFADIPAGAAGAAADAEARPERADQPSAAGTSAVSAAPVPAADATDMAGTPPSEAQDTPAPQDAAPPAPEPAEPEENPPLPDLFGPDPFGPAAASAPKPEPAAAAFQDMVLGPRPATDAAAPETSVPPAATADVAPEAVAPEAVAPDAAEPAAHQPPAAAEHDAFLASAGLGGPQWEEPSVSAATAGALLAQRPGEAVLTPVGAAEAEAAAPQTSEQTSEQTPEQPPEQTFAPSAAQTPPQPPAAEASAAPAADAAPQAALQATESEAPQAAAPAPPTPASPLPPQAASAAPPAAAAMPGSAAPTGSASWADRALADEWVGEPMPLGTPVNTARPQASAQPAAAAAQPAAPAAPPASTPGQDHRRYVSPSISTAGEWVGEPMPIPKKPGGAAPSTQPPAPAAPRPKPAATQPLSQPGRAAAAEERPPRTPLTLTGRPEPQSVFAPPREMPRTAAGRLILKLLGGLGDGHEAARAEPEAAPQAAPAGSPGRAAKDASIVNFIAGAAPDDQAHSAEAAPTPAAATPPTGAAPEAAPQAAQPAPPTAAPFLVPPQQADAALLRLVERLDAAMADAQEGYHNRRCRVVGEAAARIAAESDSFGFRVLARMARCVERAARANDINALHDLLPELAVAVERNRIALNPRRQG